MRSKLERVKKRSRLEKESKEKVRKMKYLGVVLKQETSGTTEWRGQQHFVLVINCMRTTYALQSENWNTKQYQVKRVV